MTWIKATWCGRAPAARVSLAVFAGLVLAVLPAAAQNAQWGTVKGRIVWKGDVPTREKLDAIINKAADKKFCLKDGSVLSDRWVINEKDKGLRWTFVWLAPDGNAKLQIHPELKKPPKEPVVVDQPLCMFIPHALGLREGQELLVKNPAAVAHSFKWGGGEKNPGNSIIMPANGKPYSIKNLVADKTPVTMECAIHPWMQGRIMVFDHPYYMVTDESGNFEIKNAPAGKLKIIARHSTGLWLGSSLANATKVIEVKADAVTDVGNWEFPAPKDVK